MAKILIVENDRALSDALQYNLAHQEYEVCTAQALERVVDRMRQERPDLIVLGLTMPDAEGGQAERSLGQACRTLRQACSILRQETISPILVLAPPAEQVGQEDELVEVGADDYMTKPFSMREFLARTKSLLRRATFIRRELGSDDDPLDAARLRSGDLTIDQVRRAVTRGGHVLRLKPQEYELLAFLVRNRGIALPRELILQQVWGWHRDVGSRTVDVHVRWLRSKIEADPAAPQRIVTVRGVGYRFEG
jgi:DNA-binding response OmpR family regulator